MGCHCTIKRKEGSKDFVCGKDIEKYKEYGYHSKSEMRRVEIQKAERGRKMGGIIGKIINDKQVMCPFCFIVFDKFDSERYQEAYLEIFNNDDYIDCDCPECEREFIIRNE